MNSSPARPSARPATGFLMEALAAAGNVAEALRVYDDLRVLLRDELGTRRPRRCRRCTSACWPARATPEIAAEPPAVAARRAARRASARRSWRASGELACCAPPGARRGGKPRLVFVAGRARHRQDAPDEEFARGRTRTARCSTRPARRRRSSPTSPSWRRCAAPGSTGRGSPHAGRGRARAADPRAPGAARTPRAERPGDAALPAVRGGVGAPRRGRAAARSRSCSTTCTGPTAATLHLLRHVARARARRRC